MHRTIQLLLSGITSREIADMRVELVNAVLGAKRSCVEYVHGGTKCPMCHFLGIEQGRVTVERTDGSKRHCICSRCAVTFTAVAEAVAAEVAPVVVEAVPVVKRVKAKKKKRRK